jgi:hypothetical protein
MSTDLDFALSQPLAELPDNGFSARVMAQLEAERQLKRLRRDRLVTDIAMGLVLLAVLVLPFTPLGQMLAASAFTPTGMTVTAIVLTALVGAFYVRKPGLISI